MISLSTVLQSCILSQWVFSQVPHGLVQVVIHQVLALELLQLLLPQQPVQWSLNVEERLVADRVFVGEDLSPSSRPALSAKYLFSSSSDYLMTSLQSLLYSFLSYLALSLFWLSRQDLSTPNCWSGGTTPTIVKRSAIICPLILRSRGLSVFKDGERLISSSQGLRLLSSKISKPKTSKQLVLQGTDISIALKTVFSMLRMDFMITSSILAQAAATSCPYCFKYYLSAQCDHL